MTYMSYNTYDTRPTPFLRLIIAKFYDRNWKKKRTVIAIIWRETRFLKLDKTHEAFIIPRDTKHWINTIRYKENDPQPIRVI